MRGLHAGRAAALMLTAGLLSCGTAVADDAVSASLVALGEARMPSGMAAMCARQPDLCRAELSAAEPIVPSPQQWDLITRVNAALNHAIRATTDEQLYGRAEYWALPQDAGDCEDFVLLKRETLAVLGIPRSLLLITVVRDENGEAHAVLSIPTRAGDVVLDNRRDQVLDWRRTGYSFLKRQSGADPMRWVALSRDRLQTTNIASGPGAEPSR